MPVTVTQATREPVVVPVTRQKLPVAKHVASLLPRSQSILASPWEADLSSAPDGQQQRAQESAADTGSACDIAIGVECMEEGAWRSHSETVAVQIRPPFRVQMEVSGFRFYPCPQPVDV